MLALRVFQSCLSVLAVSFLFRERLHPSRPPVFFLPGICEKKISGQRIWAAGDKRAHFGSMPAYLARPLHSTWSASLRCERHDLVRCEWRRNRWQPFFLVASDTEELSCSVTDPTLLPLSSWAFNELGLEWSLLRSHLAAGWMSVFSQGAIKSPTNTCPPSSPTFVWAHDILVCPPLVSHTSLCFSCSNICWRCWIKRIRAPASSGWVCGHTSLLAHSYQIEGKAEPSVQAVQSYICTRWTHLLGGWTSGFSAAHYGCALGLPGQDARQWGSRSGCSFTQGPEECDRPGSTHPKHLGTPCVSTLRQQVQQVINKSPELVSKRLCTLENDLLVWAQNNLHSLKVTHVPGKMNQGADMLSRNNVFSEEWTLHPLTFQRIWEVFGRARVDLFASEDNSHCSIFFYKEHGSPGPRMAQPSALCFPPSHSATAGTQESQGTTAQADSNSPPLEETTVGVGVIPAVESSPVADPLETGPPLSVFAGYGQAAYPLARLPPLFIVFVFSSYTNQSRADITAWFK